MSGESCPGCFTPLEKITTYKAAPIPVTADSFKVVINGTPIYGPSFNTEWEGRDEVEQDRTIRPIFEIQKDGQTFYIYATGIVEYPCELILSVGHPTKPIQTVRAIINIPYL